MSEPRDPHDWERSLGGSIQWDFHHATPDRRLPRWLWIMLGACVLVIAGISIARAAEIPGRWEITLFYSGKDYDFVSATHRVLATYDSREECRVVIARVKVHVSGARLSGVGRRRDRRSLTPEVV